MIHGVSNYDDKKLNLFYRLNSSLNVSVFSYKYLMT